MAQTSKGQKFNRVPGHWRKIGDKKVWVKEHDRSNPFTSHGKKRQ